MRYYRENPEEPICHDWLTGIAARVEESDKITYEQDTTGEWQAIAACGHECNPDEADPETGLCVNCAPEEEAK